MGYVWPPNVTEFTANSITTGSFVFSLRLRRVTVRLSVAPAGITAPFEPLTASSIVAVTWSPTALVFVQIREFECVLSVAPAGIVPTAPPPVEPGWLEAPGFVVAVLPLAVSTGAGAGAGVLGFDAGRLGVLAEPLDDGRVVRAAG